MSELFYALVDINSYPSMDELLILYFLNSKGALRACLVHVFY